MGQHQLDNFEMKPATLQREWVVTIDTPLAGVSVVQEALGRELPLTQGPYDNCMFVREAGYQRFRALEGSHAGNEKTIQQTAAAQIIFSLPCETKLLKKAFEIIFSVHVNEEPTIRVAEVWASRSKFVNDKDNPNRYWNRADADELHGKAV